MFIFVSITRGIKFQSDRNYFKCYKTSNTFCIKVQILSDFLTLFTRKCTISFTANLVK